jgi:hypothetical protein
LRFKGRAAFFGVIAVVLFIGLLVYLTVGQRQVRAEVCVEFMGRTNCRTASGPSQEAAVRTATDNACATISSGMTESMSCGNKPPISVRILD